MTGFWNPALAWIWRTLSALGAALISALPKKLQPFLPLVDDAQTIRVNHHNDLTSIETEPDAHLVSIEIGPDLVLSHNFALPLAAKGDAGNAVKLEAERILPLDTEEFHLTHRLGQPLGGDAVEVQMMAIRRRLADAIFNWAGQRHVIIKRIALASAGDLPAMSLSFSTITVRNLVRAAAVVSLVATAMYVATRLPNLYAARLEAAIDATDADIAASRRQTAQIAGLQRQMRAMETLASAIEERRRDAQLLDLMVQLTKASPDTVSLEELRIEGQRLALRGTAQSPEDWVVTLQRNPAFRDVSLSSVLGEDRDGNRRFEIRMDAVWPSERSEDED